MAIYIDHNVHRDDLSEQEIETIYKYLYFLFRMVAYKCKWFDTTEMYDNYSLFGATYMYFRYLRDKEIKVRSVMNYINSSAYFIKVQFEQLEFAQVISDDKDMFIDIEYEYSFQRSLKDSIKCFSLSEYEMYFSSIPATIKDFLKHIPYKGDIFTNIYISCLLSIINIFVFSKEELTKLKSHCYPRYITYEDIYQWNTKIILYELPDSYKSYIYILVQEIKYLICKDLSEILITYSSSYELSSKHNNLAVNYDQEL